MGCEIYERRLVTRNGSVTDDGTERHHEAVIYSPGRDDQVTVEMDSDGEAASFTDWRGDESPGRVRLPIADLFDAIFGLRRLQGKPVLSGEEATTAERAARVVENAARLLEEQGNPVAASAATDLRATMVALIDMAARQPNAAGTDLPT